MLLECYAPIDVSKLHFEPIPYVMLVTGIFGVTHSSLYISSPNG